MQYKVVHFFSLMGIQIFLVPFMNFHFPLTCFIVFIEMQLTIQLWVY